MKQTRLEHMVSGYARIDVVLPAASTKSAADTTVTTAKRSMGIDLFRLVVVVVVESCALKNRAIASSKARAFRYAYANAAPVEISLGF